MDAIDRSQVLLDAHQGGGAGMSDASQDTGPDEGLERLVGRGLGWSFLNNILSRLGTMLSGVVLARLLVPEDYGTFAVALIVLNAGLSMNELGVSMAIVRWAEGVQKIAPTVATLAMVWSAVLYAVCFVTAPLVAVALHAPAATNMIRVLAACILVDALAAVPAALITRHFLQRRRMVIDLVGFLVGTTVSILLAVAGAGAWCMVWGFVASNVISGVLSIVLAPCRYGYGFSADAAGTLLRFGLPLAGSSAVVFLMLNADYVVVGRTLGGEQLGYYVLAFNVCSWPVSLVSLAVRRVSFAGFSRLADVPQVAADAFRRSAGVVLALSLPLCALLAFYAEPAISFLYGSRWLPSVDTLRVLCVLGAARIFTELAYDFLTAVNRSRENLWIQVLWVVLLVPALTYGAFHGGILGVALAHAALALAVIVPCYLFLLRGSSVVLARLASSTARPLAAVVVVGATSALVLRFVDGAFLQLALGGTLGLVSSIVLVRPMRHQLGGVSSSTAA